MPPEIAEISVVPGGSVEIFSRMFCVDLMLQGPGRGCSP